MGKPDRDAVKRTNTDSVFKVTKPVCDGMIERGCPFPGERRGGWRHSPSPSP